jgi:hypothetical protein
MIEFPSKESGRREKEATQAWIERVRAAGHALIQRGVPLGRYFSLLDDSAVATQRDTKDHLPRKLKAAAKAPQVVTVQPRGGEKGGAYVIIPLDTMAEMLERQAREEQFVPITASLREISGDTEIPVFASRGSGRRRRSSSTSLVAPASED